MSHSPAPIDAAGPGRRGSPASASLEIAVPQGRSSLHVALAILRHLVSERGAVVTEAEVVSADQASFRLRIARRGAEPPESPDF